MKSPKEYQAEPIPGDLITWSGKIGLITEKTYETLVIEWLEVWPSRPLGGSVIYHINSIGYLDVICPCKR